MSFRDNGRLWLPAQLTDGYRDSMPTTRYISSRWLSMDDDLVSAVERNKAGSQREQHVQLEMVGFQRKSRHDCRTIPHDTSRGNYLLPRLLRLLILT